MANLVLNIVLGVLVLVLAILLFLRRHQSQKSRPVVDLERVLQKLHDTLIINRTEGKIQKVAAQLSDILTRHLESDRIIFFRHQRNFMEINYVYGLKNLNRAEYRIKLTAPLLKKLTDTRLLIDPVDLRDLFPDSLNRLFKDEKLTMGFPIFWMDNLFGVYFIRTQLPIDHPLVRMLFVFLNQNLSVAYHIRKLESARQLLETKLDENRSETGDGSHLESPAVEKHQTDDPGHLIEMFSCRKSEDLVNQVFERVKTGLQAERLIFMLPPNRQGKSSTRYVWGLERDEFRLDHEDFPKLFGSMQKHQIYGVEQLHDIPAGNNLKERLAGAAISRLSTFCLTENETGLLFWSGKSRDMQGESRLLLRLETVAQKALINAREYERVEEMSYTDSLTGLYNHRYFVKRLGEEVQRAARYHRRLGLLLYDIDDFKLYNDNFGHQWGDELLRRMASTLAKSLRSIDIVSRYGGDEFCIIMPEADKTTCEVFMDRLRHAIAKTDFRDRANGFAGNITISIGSALYPDDAENPERLIYCADMALLQSKAAGRNRSTVFSENLLKE